MLAAQIAQDQARLGRSVIPQKAARNKDERIPLVKWAPWQTARADEKQIADWWNRWPNANPMIVTGAISGLIALDIDEQAGLDWLAAQGIPDTFTVSRGAPGRCHLHFRHPGFHVSNTTIYPGVEVKGDGALIPAPGARHWSGIPYRVDRDVPLADLPAWLIDLLRPKPRPPVVVKPLPRWAGDRARVYALAAVDREKADLGRTSAHRNDQLFQAAAALGSFIPRNLLTAAEIDSALRPVAVSIGLLDGAARLTIASGIKHGIANPRDLPDFSPDSRARSGAKRFVWWGNGTDRRPFNRRDNGLTSRLTGISCNQGTGEKSEKWAGRERAQTAKSRMIYNHIGAALGTLAKLLSSDEASQALDTLPVEKRSRATEYRRKSRTNLHSINTTPDQESETDEIMPKDVVINHATLVSPSQIRINRLRLLFPQSDPVTALIPISELTPELFADELTDQDITALQEHATIRTLTAKQRQAVRARLRVLRKVETFQKQIDDIPFELPERPIKNLPDLRAHVLRQICKHFADSHTGKSKLSNMVQALLLGVTPGALPGIRARACIEQTAPDEVQHEHTNAARLPGNCRYVKVRDVQGNVKAYHRATDPGIYDTIAQAMRDGYQVFTILQPVAEQRVLPLTAPAPREHTVKVEAAQGNPMPAGIPHAPGETRQNTTPPRARKRRAPREQYAGLLMRNILYHLGKQASADDPLDELAAQVRRAISTPWIDHSQPPEPPDDPGDLSNTFDIPPADEFSEFSEPVTRAQDEHRQTVADILNDLQTVKELTERLKQVRAA